MPVRLCFSSFSVERRVESVKVLAVEVVLDEFERFTETLKMHDFAFTQKSYRVADVGVVDEANQVVIGCARLLFRRHIFAKVGDGVALAGERHRRERRTCRRGGIDARRVVDVIRCELRAHNLLGGQATGELVDYRRNDFHMCQFFGAYVRQKPRHIAARHTVPLGQITHRSADFAVGATQLADYHCRQIGVGT